MVVLPTFQDRSARFSYDIELAGELFRLFFSWNARETSWYMDIQDQNENNILTGIKMVPMYQLLRQYRAYATLPDGDFMLWDLRQDSDNSNVNFDNFGKRYQLLFVSREEIETGEIII
jgi:hypothetical protein